MDIQFVYIFLNLNIVFVWVLLTVIYITYDYLFQSSDFKRTLYWHCNRCFSNRESQLSTTVGFVLYITTLIWLRCYIFSINLFDLSTVCPNTISTGFVTITESKVSFFCLWVKVVPAIKWSYYVKNYEVIGWLSITIHLHYLSFHISNTWFETTFCWHCNRYHERYIWRI